LVRVRVWGA